MAFPDNVSSPDITRTRTSEDMAVSPAGATAPDHDQPKFKRTLYKSSPLQSGTTDSTADKNCTPSTGDKRVPRENKNLMDNLNMQLDDNEQMGDVRKQLRFNEEARASANARKDMLQMRMIEMKRMEMEVRRQMAELAEKHMRQIEEMKMRTMQMTQKAEWMKAIIGQQQTILEQQQTTLEQLQTILEQVASVNDLVCRRLQQRFKEEQEQEKEQEEREQQRQQQEENKEKEQQEQQEEGEEQQEEEQQQQAAATALAGSSTSRQQQQQAIAEQEQRDQQEHRVQIDAKWLSARADRRLAALQRQEREREAQQWVEQLRNQEPKASGNERAALRYLTREIGTVAGILAGTDSISH
jgi:hypothetical protein